MHNLYVYWKMELFQFVRLRYLAVRCRTIVASNIWNIQHFAYSQKVIRFVDRVYRFDGGIETRNINPKQLCKNYVTVFCVRFEFFSVLVDFFCVFDG